MNLDGTSEEDIVTGITSGGTAIDLKNDKIYYVNRRTGIFYSNLDGTSPIQINNSLDDIYSMAVAPELGKLYWTETNSKKLKISDLDGSNVIEVDLSIYGVLETSITVSERVGKLFISSHATNTILRGDLDGSNLSTYVTTNTQPWASAVDSEKNRLYWVGISGTNTISYISLDDPSSINVFLTGLPGIPLSIALADYAPVPTADEDGVLTFNLDHFNVDDVNINTLTKISISEDVEAGQLQLNGVDINPTLENPVEITKDQIETGELTFTPTANSSGDDYASFKFKWFDEGGTVDKEYTIGIKVNAVNDAPILDNSHTLTMTGVLENSVAGDIVGDSVASLIVDGSITEAVIDEIAVEALAITTADSTNGQWQYFVDSWVNFPTISTTTALLLDSANKVRFVPNNGWSGKATFTFHAWDKSSGSAGATADTTTTGGITPFSVNSETVTVTVAPLNTAPTLTIATPQTMYEGDSLEITLAMTNGADVDLNDELTVVVEAGLNYSVDGTTITPALDWSGELTVPVHVKDSSGATSPTVNMTVTVVALIYITEQALDENPDGFDKLNEDLTYGGVTSVIDENLPKYQEEIKRSIELVQKKKELIQKIIDEVNKGNTTAVVSVVEGWNMLSCPFEGWNPDAEFGDSALMVYSFVNGAYAGQESDQEWIPGKGYWLFLTGVDTSVEPLAIVTAGVRSAATTIEVNSGWNLFGPIAYGTSFTDIDSLKGYPFYFDITSKAYRVFPLNDPLKHGYGYWGYVPKSEVNDK